MLSGAPGFNLTVFKCCNLVMKYVFSSGIGTGAGSSIFGFLTRSTAPEDRATAFASVMACRQAGLLIGQCSAAL